MSLSTIGALHTASGGRPVGFDFIGSTYWHVIKAAFGAEGTVTLVTDTTPLPNSMKGKMAVAVPAAGTAGVYTDILVDSYGRMVVTDDAPDAEKLYVSAESAASSHTVMAAIIGYTAKITAASIRNFNNRKTVTISFKRAATTLFTVILPPASEWTLPAPFKPDGAGNEAVTIVPSDATVKLSIYCAYTKVRV